MAMAPWGKEPGGSFLYNTEPGIISETSPTALITRPTGEPDGSKGFHKRTPRDSSSKPIMGSKPDSRKVSDEGVIPWLPQHKNPTAVPSGGPNGPYPTDFSARK